MPLRNACVAGVESRSLHCYAHSHGRLQPYGRSMDMGVDTNGFRPYRIEEVVERLKAVSIETPDAGIAGMDR